MEVPCYLPKLLFELNEQRKRDFFCDCSILVEGRVFKAHRNVLFAGSGYFRALLVHYLQDSGQRHSTASLDIVTADAFSIILDFLYSGCLALNRSNVIEVMSAASYLQMTDLVNFCKGYICSSLEICHKEERNTEEVDQAQDGGIGPADSGTPAATVSNGAGDGLVVPVKLHKCPFCPYTAKQKGIMKRHIRCHTGERPFPCPMCGKRFTRQEHLRSHTLSVHRHYWPVSCKSCRRSFTGSSVSPGLRRFGICESCNCVTTTHDDSAPVHPASQPESMEHADGGTDWSSFMDDVDEVEVGRVEDLVEKQMLERQLVVCTDVAHTLRVAH
uniref:zinc finger and BTB domain-containing protein 8B isoform X2 n=1 Tax=Monopterus albus TaxID=43700 RepID=UPI0009B49DF7|nr:zinc finger and BTB domain-containing protein 8B-like isoform X2 [Monopterus albus]